MDALTHQPAATRNRRGRRRRHRIAISLVAAAALVAGAASAGAAPGADPIDAPGSTGSSVWDSPMLASTDEVAWAYTYDISSPPGEENFHVMFDVGVAPDGGSVVVGEYFGTLVIGSGGSQVTLTGAGPAQQADSGLGFIAKFDPDNQLVWAQEAGAAGVEAEVAADGTIAMAGNFSGTATFGTGGSARSLTANGEYDGFLARYAADGTLEWAVRSGGPSTGLLQFGCQSPRDFGSSVSFTADGGILFVGGTTGAATLTDAAGTSTSLPGAAEPLNGFVARYAADGSLEWAQRIQGPAADPPPAVRPDNLAESVAVLPDGSAVVAGFFRDSATFGTGANATTLSAEANTDIFVARYGPTGALSWVRQAGGDTEARPATTACGGNATVDEHWPTDLAGAVAVSPDGDSIVIGGEIVGTVTFGSGAGEIELPGDAGDDRDVFVARYDTAGDVVWAQRGAGPGDLLGGRGIAATSEGGAVYTGYFTESATFGPVALSGQAGSTMFVVRYGPDGSVSWANAGGPDSVGWGVDLSPAENAIVVGQGPGPVQLGTASVGLASVGLASGHSPPTAFRAQYGTAPGFEAIPPTRLVDTRSRPTSVDGQTLEVGPVPAGSVIRVPVSGVGPIPDDVDAVTLNLTVVEAAEAGYASVYPCGTEPPTSSNLNYPAGGTVPVAAVTAVGDDGAVCVFADRSAHYLVDVTAFVAAGFGPITPERVLDQRPAQASRGDVIRVSLADVVPAGATAVALMLTGVETATAGFATVDDCTPSPGEPTTSNLNLALGETRSNSVITSMSPDREVCISADAEASYLLDVAGWFTAGFQPVDPERLLDTRSAPSTVNGQTLQVGPVPGGSVIEVPVAGRAGVPQAAVGVAVNLTVVEPAQPGYATLFPCDGSPPEASNLNYGVGGAVANGAYTGLSDGGSVCIFTDQTGQYLLDVTGWFVEG